jgi:hypothetical protein
MNLEQSIKEGFFISMLGANFHCLTNCETMISYNSINKVGLDGAGALGSHDSGSSGRGSVSLEVPPLGKA